MEMLFSVAFNMVASLFGFSGPMPEAPVPPPPVVVEIGEAITATPLVDVPVTTTEAPMVVEDSVPMVTYPPVPMSYPDRADAPPMATIPTTTTTVPQGRTIYITWEGKDKPFDADYPDVVILTYEGSNLGIADMQNDCNHRGDNTELIARPRVNYPTGKVDDYNWQCEKIDY